MNPCEFPYAIEDELWSRGQHGKNHTTKIITRDVRLSFEQKDREHRDYN